MRAFLLSLAIGVVGCAPKYGIEDKTLRLAEQHRRTCYMIGLAEHMGEALLEQGLSIADVDYSLARANAEHFGSRMPTVVIEVDEPDMLCSASLSQLWTDTVYVYSKMIGVNPGSNPEVREVRDRSENLLSSFARGSGRT